MPRTLQFLFGTFILVLLIGAPLGYASYRHNQIRNFRVVRDGVLYRSGQMSLDGLKRVVYDYRIKTVVTLRDAYTPGEPAPDGREEAFCLAEELNYVRMSPLPWWAQVGPAPVEVNVRKFREIMDDESNYPVLIHCFAGIHRTGAYCAIYRMEHDHWSNAEAMAEMKGCGYTNLNEELDILGYLEDYRPTWKEADEPISTQRRATSWPARKSIGKKKSPAKSAGDSDH